MPKTRVALGCAVVLSLMSAGCAAIRAGDVPDADGSRLVETGVGAAPPEGVVAFCATHANYCGPSRLRGMQAADTATGAAGLPAAASLSSEQLFQLLLRTRVQSYASEEQVMGPVEVTLDLRRWRELWAINAAVNWDLLPARDQDIYGRNEVWAMPLTERASGARPRGDCEDFVLEKRAKLLDAGWPANSLSIVTAIAPGEGLHAVLVAHTDRGDFVLDNLLERPRPIGDVPYTWLTRQTGPDILSWSHVTVQAAPASDLAD